MNVRQIVIPGNPVAKERPRFGRGRVYTPTTTVAYEESIAWQIRKSGIAYGDANVSVRAEFYCAPLVGRKQTGDTDNYLKAVLDGAQKGGLFNNDRQVVRVEAERIDGSDDPRTVLTVSLWP